MDAFEYPEGECAWRLRISGRALAFRTIQNVTSQKVMVVIEKSLDTPAASCYAHNV